MSRFDTNRIEVTAQWLFEHPDAQGYIYNRQLDDMGLDPWIDIVGVDALKDGSKIILEIGRTGEQRVDPTDTVFVQNDPSDLDLLLVNAKVMIENECRRIRTGYAPGPSMRDAVGQWESLAKDISKFLTSRRVQK